MIFAISVLLVSAVAFYFVAKSKPQPSKLAVHDGQQVRIPARLSGWIPWIGMGLEWGKDSGGLISRCKKSFGDVFVLFMGGVDMMVVVEPIKGIPSIFRNTKTLSFSPITQHIMAVGFDCNPKVAKDNKVEALFKKQYIQFLSHPNFVKELTGRYLGFLEESLNQEFPLGSQPKIVDLWKWTDAFIFKSAMRTIFGTKLPVEEFYEDFKIFDKNFPDFTKGTPSFLMKEGETARKRSKEVIEKWEKAGDFSDASTLMKNREEMMKENGYDSWDRAGCNLAIMWALQGNSNPAAFWSLAHVVSDKELMDKVRSQVSSTLKALLNVPVLKSLLSESLRFHGSVLSLRHANEDTSIVTENDVYLAKKGVNIVINTRDVHMDPEIHSNPEEFQYDRFLENNIEDSQVKIEEGPSTTSSTPSKHTKNGKPVKHHLIPFGGGSSLCPGRHFASNEIISTVAILCHFLDFEPITPLPQTDLSRAGLGVMWADKPFEVSIKRRTPL